MKTCVICGKEFESNYPQKMTCSAECSREYKRRQDRIYKSKKSQPSKGKCPHCGKEFEKSGNGRIRKFCSQKCCRAYHNAKRSYEPRKRQPRLCAQCGKEFTPTNNNQKYCSAACCESAWGRSVVIHTLTCKICGKTFTDVYNAKYCSQKCRNEAIKKEQAKQAMAKATGEKVKTLSEWAKEASECNMDYGKYRGLIQSGKTFEELKATADTRSEAVHAHACKGMRHSNDSAWGQKVG